jgi:hypothetical protein
MSVPSTNIGGCFDVIQGSLKSPSVVGRDVSYDVTVKPVAGAVIDGQFLFQVLMPLSGLKPKRAFGDRWSCPAPADQLITCTRSDPPSAGLSYPPVTIEAVVEVAACPTLSRQAMVFATGAIQDVSLETSETFGCLQIPQNDIDFGVAPFPTAGSEYVGVMAGFRVTSTDTHPIRMSMKTPPGYREHYTGFSTGPSKECSGAVLTFGDTCAFTIEFLPCFASAQGVIEVVTDYGSTYTIPLRGVGVPRSLRFEVSGAVDGTLEPGRDYTAQVVVTPQPQFDCPRNRRPNIEFSFKQAGVSEISKYDAQFDSETGRIHAGTVAGTITLTAKIDGEEIKPMSGDISTQFVVPEQKGVIESVTLDSQTNSTLGISVTGYSTPREIGADAKTEVCVEFLPGSGSVINGTHQFCALKSEIQIWYEREGSRTFGSRFKGSITASLTGDKAAISGLKIVLMNKKGPSEPFCIDVPSGNKRSCPN